MHSLFDPADRDSVLERLALLQPGAARQWGKMGAAQMLAHCSIAMEMATGHEPRKQKLIGKILGPFVKASLLGEKPFSKNSPTDPAFVVIDEKDFEAEKDRLGRLVNFLRGRPGEGLGLHALVPRQARGRAVGRDDVQAPGPSPAPVRRLAGC
jgi:hypothetical protein